MRLTIIPDSLNRVNPSYKFVGQGTIRLQCKDMSNFIIKNDKMVNAGGTHRIFEEPLGLRSTWGIRYYGQRGDGSLVKRLFYYGDGNIHNVDETAKTSAVVYNGLTKGRHLTDETFQVSGNSVLYIYTGADYPITYDGNGDNTFNQVSSVTCPYKFAQGVEHLDRMWAFEPNTSTLHVSKNLFPSNFIDASDSYSYIIGKDKDSVIVGIALLGGVLYIFKSNSIYYLFGRTPNTWQLRQVTEKFGLETLKALKQVGSNLVFLNSYDREWYAFGGNEASIQDLSSQELDYSTLADTTPARIDDTRIVEFDGEVHIAFKNYKGEGDYNNAELIFSTKEVNERGLPRWNHIEGSNVGCYIKKDQRDDVRELVTGRSEDGLLMYYGRGDTWDGDRTAIEKSIKFFDICPHISQNMVFSFFWLNGHTNGSNEVGFRHMPDSFISDRGELTFNQKGEQKTLGFLKLEKMEKFGTRIIPYTRYRKGHSMAVEIWDNAKNKAIELYSIAIEISTREKVRNEYQGD